MPLIPNDDPAALAELLGYLEEIGYGEVYLRPPASAGVAPAPAWAVPAGEQAAHDLAELAAAARDAGVGGVVGGGGVAGSGRVVGGAAGAAAADLAAGAGDPAAEAAAAAVSAAPSAEGGDAATRAAELAAQAEVVASCRRCRLCEGRNRTVYGAGNGDADLMFIGEGPGAEEDRQGLPFVGRAGELLTRIIAAIDMTREQVYIANIVKCRPPGNRDPQPDEVAACRPYLERQVRLVRPRLLVALGRIAAQTLLGTDLPIGRMRGQWFQVMGVPTMVTYHPAALLRNPALKRPTWEDMQQVRDRLQSGAGGSA
jgi:uracil-DNA glycosylase family 4